MLQNAPYVALEVDSMLTAFRITHKMAEEPLSDFALPKQTELKFPISNH